MWKAVWKKNRIHWLDFTVTEQTNNDLDNINLQLLRLFQFLEFSTGIFFLESILVLQTSPKKHLKLMGAILFPLEPNSHINWYPRPCFLYFPCAVERKHICSKFKFGNGMFRVPEVILHSLRPKFFSLPPDCTCVGEHLPQGASNMSLSWHPFCEFQKYKLASVGRRLGTAL